MHNFRLWLFVSWAEPGLGWAEAGMWGENQLVAAAAGRPSHAAPGLGRREASLQIVCVPRYCGAHVSSCVESPRSAPILPGKAGLAGALQLVALYCVVKVQVAPLPPPASLCSPPGPRPASITRLQFNCYQGFLQFCRGPSSRYSISLPADSVWSPCTLQGT